jgi:serine protease DegS
MKLRNTALFIYQTITVALAAIIVVLFIKPELLQQGPQVVAINQQASQQQAGQLPTTGPYSYAPAVENAAPAVVNIYTARLIKQRTNPLLDDPLFRQFFGGDNLSIPQQRLETSLGSGVIMSDQGHIITNHHVIQDADRIRVQLRDGRTTDARVIGIDTDTDLAVLQIKLDQLPSITLAAAGHMQVGDVVMAIGNPFGVGQTVTMGIISATGRTELGINIFENFIQTDAAINPGNSGGALINARGELVGINTAIVSETGGNQGIGFAIPNALAVSVMQQIIEHGRVMRGWLGVESKTVTAALAQNLRLPQSTGVLVSGVLRHGPADSAGLLPGDVITSINAVEVTTSRELLNSIALTSPGAEVVLGIIRNARPMTLTVAVGERPPMIMSKP